MGEKRAHNFGVQSYFQLVCHIQGVSNTWEFLEVYFETFNRVKKLKELREKLERLERKFQEKHRADTTHSHPIEGKPLDVIRSVGVSQEIRWEENPKEAPCLILACVWGHKKCFELEGENLNLLHGSIKSSEWCQKNCLLF